MAASPARLRVVAPVPGTGEALAAWQRGETGTAEAICRDCLVRDAGDIAARRLLGIIAHRNGRHEHALPLLREVAAREAARNGADAAGDHSNLGAALRALGRVAEAEQALRRAIALGPGFAAAHFNLGNLLTATCRYEEAEVAYREAVRHRADYAQAWNGLGIVLQRCGRLAEAAEAFRPAVRHLPDWAEALTNLGVVLLGLEQGAEAEDILRQAVARHPGHAAAHGNLGAVHLRAGQPIRAEAAMRAAIALEPQEARWHGNLAIALQMQGRHRETEACCRRALELRPDYASGHGNLLFAMNYRPDLSAETIFAEYCAWDERHAKPLLPAAPQFALDRTPGRRLRVGYVSPDFRHHAAAFFAEPLLAAHDPDVVELYCYAEVPVPDATTARFQALAAQWRSTVGLSDAEVAELIRGDRIDVLVDLGGHTASNRLLAFARRPAPVQVAYLLGHGTTSGLSAMDAFLADDALVPVGSEQLFSEQVLRLGRIPLAYRPPADMPGVAPLPAHANRRITFGHFGRPERLNDTVVAAWSRILRAVPGSRLMLNSRPFQEPEFCALFQARFAGHGIGAERLELVFTCPQPRTWEAYGTIDIALDPFPHNAGTTTIEALWQGVPVVSLAGRPTVGRFGASILHALGLDDWVAADADAYVTKAVAAASDIDALARLRAGLRDRFKASPLYDASGLARAIEASYKSLWAQWRDGAVPTLHKRFASGDLAGAERMAQRMLRRDPGESEALHVLAHVAHRTFRPDEADRRFAQAIALSPGNAELHANHAAILRGLGRLDAAEAAARRAIALRPDGAEAYSNLGNILRDAGRHGESIDCYRAAVRLLPGFTDAWANLAWVLSLNGQAGAAEEAARRAIALDPRHANGHNNLGLALMRQSRLDEAEVSLRAALTLRPDFALPHSNILFCLNYRPDLSAETIFAEYCAWDERHAKPLLPAAPQFALDRTPGRRLRVGYVSPDFRHHAAAFFAEPLLAAHDPDVVELYCYAEVPVPDATTARFQALAAQWRGTVGMTDAEVAELIRGDRIDVLVDLGGHTASNRLLAFARRPAPVQVAYLLGHGTTSGLSAMDAFLADDALVPVGSEHLFSEQVLRLGRIPLAYRPPADMPEVAPLPAAVAGKVTFGYFGRTVRLNDGVIAAWARILRVVPGSRLTLNSAPFAEPDGRTRIIARFAEHGIGAERLELVFTHPQPRTWEAYGTIDIALDPFPHNAGTTTIEALWQGVPVVSLAGRPTVGRFGASILHALGLDDWVAADADAYVTRAVAAASDIDALARLRAGLRDRFKASPLYDASGLARAIETAYRALWERWRTWADHERVRLSP